MYQKGQKVHVEFDATYVCENDDSDEFVVVNFDGVFLMASTNTLTVRDDPESDPLGTVRQESDESATYVKTRHGWVVAAETFVGPWSSIGEIVTHLPTTRVTGSLPGSPAADGAG